MATKAQVQEVREAVDQLIAEGKVYRDKEGRCWPKGHPNFKDTPKH